MSDQLGVASQIQALLGSGTTYEGKLAFEGTVRIDGTFKGEILSDGILVVGEDAKIDGTIEVGTVIVRGGEIHGTIRANRVVEIHAPGRMHGDIHTPQLFIEKGVIFDGKCTMEGTETHTLDDTWSDRS